jgi:hypothetical protein
MERLSHLPKVTDLANVELELKPRLTDFRAI